MAKHNHEDEEDFSFSDYASPEENESNKENEKPKLEEMPPELLKALQLALLDTTLVCPDCGGVCKGHTIRLRDLILKRSEYLAAQLLRAIDLYKQARAFGLLEPGDLIDPIYTIWEALVDLYEVSEPQEFIDKPPPEEEPDNE